VFAQQNQDVQLANEYYLKGNKEKAILIYRELAENDVNIPVIHNNYLNALLDLSYFTEAQSYLKRIQRKDPGNLQYRLDQGILMVRSGELPKADKYFSELIESNKPNTQTIKMMSDYLASRNLTDYSIQALSASRQALGNRNLFSLELAMLYRMQGEKDKMVNEYLNYVTQSSANIQYVKNVLQALLTSPEDLQSLEKLLYTKVQQEPENEVFSDLLIWVTMQQKNFYGSFVQARAYDRRYNKQGDKCMEVARVALDNNDYSVAYQVYSYVVKQFKDSPNYLMARLGLINTRDSQMKNTFPVHRDSVSSLIKDYDSFIAEYPANAYALKAQKSKAILYATYLDQKDSAVSILVRLIENRRTSAHLKAKAKLDLGDIYLLMDEPWEATLLYSQVEKAQKENTLGYEAKLRNAKLSYYQGDFILAEAHLDILKEATTREIANDAMELSMLIKENLALDSSGIALVEYAEVELLLHQNRITQALAKLDTLKSSSSAVYALMDDIHWMEANLLLRMGRYTEAIEALEVIQQRYPSEIYADDAFFKRAEIWQQYLGDQVKAMDLYREFLNLFPGSVYAAEARKRFRTLRGDFGPEKQVP
jgi:predicted Zn-dependent protease